MTLDSRLIDMTISMYRKFKDLSLILISCSKWIDVMWSIWIVFHTSCIIKVCEWCKIYVMIMLVLRGLIWLMKMNTLCNKPKNGYTKWYLMCQECLWLDQGSHGLMRVEQDFGTLATSKPTNLGSYLS